MIDSGKGDRPDDMSKRDADGKDDATGKGDAAGKGDAVVNDVLIGVK
jgi:hypothetical protein